MPTRRFEVNKEQSVAQISAGNAGNGNDSHCPTGKFSYNTSITARTLLRFAQDYSGMTKVTKVELFVRLTGGVHTEQGGSRRAHVNRCGPSGSWDSGGGAENSWQTGVSGEVWPGPAMGTSSEGSMSGTGWQSVDITDSYKPLIPSYVTNPDGVAGAGETNNGIRVSSDDESLVSHSFEFYGAASSYPPYLLVTYETNTAPGKPNNWAPASGATTTPGVNPSFTFVGSDPDSGDSLLNFDLQVAADSAFGAPIYNGASIVPGAYKTAAWTVTNWPLPGALLPSGPLYWRVRTKDQDGAVSPWSTATQFTMGAAPTVSGTTPSGGTLADVWNLGEAAVWTSGGSHAKPIVSWVYQHANGLSGDAYRVRVYSDALATLYDSGTVTLAQAVGTRYTLNVPLAIILGTQYRWSVEVRDSAGNWSAAMTPTTFKVRWGQAIYSQNVGVSASGFHVTPGATALGRTTFLYRAADDAAGTNATAWGTGMPTAGKAYFQVLARLLATVAGSNPTVPDITLTYQASGAAPQPDKWSATGVAVELDPAVKRFGQYGLKVRTTVASGGPYIYPWRLADGDGIEVQPDTDYTYSAYIKTNGALTGGTVVRLGIRNKARNAYIATLTPCDPKGAIQTADSSAYPDGWQRLAGWFHVPDGVTVITPDVWIGASAIGQQFWVDGVKLEEGRITSLWTPGFLGDAITMDKAGIMLDASQGGLLRLRGSAGGVRDVMDLGVNGLRFGGDTELYSPFADRLAIDASEFVGNGVYSGGGQLRLIGGNYGLIVRNDGSNTYFLLTNSADQYGIWNALRPITIVDATGAVSMGNGLAVTAGGLTVGGVPVSVNTHTHNYLDRADIRVVRGTGASLAAGANAAYTITWPSAFADTNYTVMITMWTEGDPAGRQLSFAITSKTAAAVSIRVMNNTAGTAIVPGWHAIGIHD